MNWKDLLKAFVDGLAEATKDKSDDEKAKIIAEATDALPQEARQHLHDAGHAEGEKAGKRDAGKDLTTVTAERDKLKKEVEKKDREIAGLKETNPDVAKIKEEYEQRLSEKDAEVEAAKSAAKTELAAERARAATARLQTGLEGRVVSAAVARALAADPELAKRIQFDDDGTPRVYQADGKTPMALKAGADPIAALVDDVASAQPKELLRSTAGGGSGATGDGGDADEFASIRDEVKAAYGAGDEKSARERLDRLG